MLSDTTSHDNEITESAEELEDTAKYYKLLIAQSSTDSDFNTMEQKAYKKYLKRREKVDTLTARKTEIIRRKSKLQNYIDWLKSKEPVLEEWDNKLWVSMIHHYIVYRDKTFMFVFCDEREIN